MEGYIISWYKVLQSLHNIAGTIIVDKRIPVNVDALHDVSISVGTSFDTIKRIRGFVLLVGEVELLIDLIDFPIYNI